MNPSLLQSYLKVGKSYSVQVVKNEQQELPHQIFKHYREQKNGILRFFLYNQPREYSQ